MQNFKTERQVERERTDALIYADYKELLKQGGSKVEIKKYLMRRYDIKGISTIYQAIKRAEQRQLLTA